MISHWLRTATKVSLAALISLCLISGFAVKDSLALSIAQLPSSQIASVQRQPIWGCSADSGERRYVVDQLTRDANSFDMAIYERKQKMVDRTDGGDYIGTVQVDVISKESAVIGRGQTFNSTLEVGALGRTVAFDVKDSVAGSASGRCYVQWQMEDSKTRRLVRQCFALAGGEVGIAEVQRFGCTADPSNYMEKIRNASSVK